MSAHIPIKIINYNMYQTINDLSQFLLKATVLYRCSIGIYRLSENKSGVTGNLG